MIALRIEFLAGRFHANPWDRATNDGEVDWPPSPWRLLRAVVSGWYRSGAESRETMLSLLDRLAEPPAYLLPHATSGHTRHYMPMGAVKDGKLESTLVLDSFIALERDRETHPAAYIIWSQASLAPGELELLQRSCEGIPYLGRAESWCMVTVSESVPAAEGLESVDLVSRSEESGASVRRLGAGPSLRGQGLLKALTETTAEMRKARRLMPPGTAWLDYRLPNDFLLVREQFEREERTRPAFDTVTLRFLLERGMRSPKPSLKDAILFSELFRAAAIRMYSDREGEPASARLAGKAEDGAKREGHDHPYFLPFDAEGRGEIDGIDVWLPRGCTHQEYRALTSVTYLREHVIYGETFSLTFAGAVAPESAQLWRSATPVVLERFPKVRGSNGARRIIDSPEEQLRRMLGRAGYEPEEIELWPASQGIDRSRGGHLRTDGFRRVRMRKHSVPMPVAGATIRFREIVKGPIVLGSLAHFGLGRFEPELAGTAVP